MLTHSARQGPGWANDGGDDLLSGVRDLASEGLPPLLVLADVSADSKGRACGDQVRIDVAVEDRGEVHVGMEVNGCTFARASAVHMCRLVEGRSLTEASSIVARFLEELGRAPADRSEVSGPWRHAFPADRRLCVATPWEALGSALLLEERSGDGHERSFTALSCDACIVAKRVSWGRRPPDRAGDPPRGPARRVRRALNALRDAGSSKFLEELAWIQRFGKVELNRDDEVRLEGFLENLDDVTTNQLRALRLSTMVGAHAKRLGLDVMPARAARHFSEARSRHATRVAELDRVLAIASRAGDVTPVKGVVTRELYPDPAMRFFSDFDFLTPDFDSATRFARALITEGGYRLERHGSTPFSLKVLSGETGGERLTGHLHLVKRIDRHVATTDINFPGLPLALTDGTLYPKREGGGFRPAFPEQFAITIAHLFKHEVGFVKDINDCYLMLGQTGLVPVEPTIELLRTYSLEFLAGLVVQFLSREFGLRIDDHELATRIMETTRALDRWVIRKVLGQRWPYSLRPHLLAQAYDLLRRRTGKVGFLTALVEVEAKLGGAPAPAAGAHDGRGSSGRPLSSALGVDPLTRLYLVPLVLFDRFPGAEGLADEPGDVAYECTPIPGTEATLVKRHGVRLLLTPLGLFLPTSDWAVEVPRRAIAGTARDIVARLGLEGMASPVRAANY